MRWVFMLLFVVTSAPLSAVGAQEASPSTIGLEYPELLMVATDYAFEITGPVSAELTLVTMVNDGTEPHHATFQVE